MEIEQTERIAGQGFQDGGCHEQAVPGQASPTKIPETGVSYGTTTQRLQNAPGRVKREKNRRFGNGR